MKTVPSIRESAQARLLLYKLIRSKLNDAQQRILNARPELWDRILSNLETEAISKQNDQSLQKLLATIFAAIELQTSRGLDSQLKHLKAGGFIMRIKPTELLDGFIKEHLTLIKSVQREQLEKIGLNIHRGILEGRLQKDIEKSILQTTDISKKRARLIARNAPLQYSGALTRHHQTTAGITHYRWQTSQDERVRDSHRGRNHKVYSWDGPGPHPRSEVNCRCDAVPVVN